nr:disease resistance protein Roq1-like [Ziziphus jujuba var. spinosa]
MGRDESQLIQQIVEAALSKLNRTLLHVAKYPVGIESHLHELASLINAGEKDVRFIGIHGLRGIGKTTIAKAAFNSFADEFEVSSFLADVRETTKQHFVLFSCWEYPERYQHHKERLCNKRVLLFLDDVDELDQLDTLAGGHEWFGLGSRIIITTKNKHLLATHGVNLIYEVRGMDHERALELLSWNAFKREKPIETYLALSDRVVCYADGLPLALVDNEKSLFLDIACFFVGEDKDYVIKASLLIFANVVLSGAIEYLPNELRLIDVPGYQFPTLSFNSGPKQLAILNMPYSHIHQLDKGFKVQLLSK